ncbi:hypothetical protein J3A83DRAFT_3562185 [Scleroderma citrinum]
MASTDKPEPGSSQSSKDGLTAGGLRDADTSAEPPVPDPTLIKSPALSPTTTDRSTTPSHQSLAPGSSSSYTAFANPPPKKFSAVNINKKFFQKTSTTSSSTPSTSLSNSSTIKSGSPAPRPSTQPSASHSRLVTAKLTSTAPLPATTGSTWSRPSSATPSVSSATPIPSSGQPSQPPGPAPTAPQLPHIGKVIQPQPRHTPASAASLTKKDGSSAKPVWGASRPTAGVSFTDNANDFPTAAEVAQGLNAKSEDNKSEVSIPSKQSGEADAFRGVHLDPNAHHWDEMEEDDDNFLDNVIEFGDGRQYKVVPTEPEQAPSATDQAVPQLGSDASADVVNHASSEVVAKEDRFADDFDRSWPRSKFSPTVIQRDFSSRSSRQASISPSSSQPSHSPLEGPRVLFNERSNRLEPYSNMYPSTRFGGLHGVSKREGRAESFSRDPPPHSTGHPMQLLQKSAESSTSTRLPHNHLRDIASSGRYPDREFGPPSALVSHQGQSRTRVRDAVLSPGVGPNSARSADDVRRRRASSGAHSSSQVDNTLLLRPSHPPDGIPHPYQGSLTQPSSTLLPGMMTSDVSINSIQLGVASPEMPHQNVDPTLDMETVHKTTMHVTAERARQRRQREEEEREREKERARKKAAELEERMKAAEASRKQTEPVTLESVEEVAGPLEAMDDSVSGLQMTSPLGLARSLSLKSHTRSSRESKSSCFGPSSDEPTPDQADSWRCKTRVSSQKFSSPTRPLVPVPPLILHGGHEPVTSTADESLEVVDFSDLGKFVGVEDVLRPDQSSPDQRPRQRGRAVASDFFEDTPTSQGPGHEVVGLWIEPSPAEAAERSTSERQHSSTQSPLAANFDGPMSLGNGHSSAFVHRPHRNFTSFREAPIAVLDDVMSRIKGALDNMQIDSAKEAVADVGDARPGGNKFMKMKPPGTTRLLPKEGKWLPPALRSQRSYHDHDQEDFGVTGCDPPHSPRLMPVVVKFPKVSRPVEPIHKRQSTVHDSAWLDILSWNPPVEGMNKRDLSINSVLFRKAKNTRYQVTLPRPVRSSGTGSRAHNPTMFSRVSQLPGRPKILDDLVSWRRRAPPDSVDQRAEQPASLVYPHDDIRHSPRASVASAEDHPEPATTDAPSTKSDKQLMRPKNQPKLPPGSAVGFYRDPSLTGQQSNGTVNFTVISELEDRQSSPQAESKITASPSMAESSSSTMHTSHTADSVTDEHSKDTAPLTAGLPESKSPEDTVERPLLTPASASFGTPWTKSPLSFSTKESPARAPDPEHLKAVWSQAADKEPVPAVNSLEGIADDLTALPFTIQDVKSEDGETPPPTSSAAPSKMSLHDVTRAFQQVPTSSGTSSHRASSMSPQSTSGLITRPSNFSYPTPIQSSTLPLRPPYTAFPPSTMLVHSPSSNLYPPAATSPIPRVQVNGPSQVYNQHVWVPMQNSQNPNGAIRPMASPYPTQMMAYPTANHPVYGPTPSAQNPSTPTNGVVHPRGMPMMSPVMHPAAPANVPIYGGSPVMMHPPPIMHRPPYMNTGPPVRGPRTDATASSPLMQQPHPQNSHPHQVYGPVTPVYNRPWC